MTDGTQVEGVQLEIGEIQVGGDAVSGGEGLSGEVDAQEMTNAAARKPWEMRLPPIAELISSTWQRATGAASCRRVCRGRPGDRVGLGPQVSRVGDLVVRAGAMGPWPIMG